MASPSLYQPSPRFDHHAAQVGEKAYLWGGRTQNFSLSSRQTLASEIEIFDVFSETWKTRTATGAPPPGLLGGACTVVSETLYHFGGSDGHSWYNTLHCLDTLSLNWRDFHGHAQNPADQPMPKIRCGLVTYTDTASLALFAGYGVPSGPTQPGARFVQNTNFTDGRGWTNEFHLFNLTNGEWTSPPTTGHRPPPCAGFSFTAINHHMAVMFGGSDDKQWFNDVYIIDFQSMEWTKLERPEGTPWPAERASHAACCLNYGDDLPQLLVTGGLDKNLKTLSDAWLLDVNTGRWRELTLSEGTLPRWGHTVTACRMCPGRVHATTFGGCPNFVFGQPDDARPKIAETTVMEFESVESGQCVLVGFIGSSGLGTPERVTKLESLKQRKADDAYQAGSDILPRLITIHPELQFQPPVAVDPIPDPLMTPTQLLATQPTLPYLHPSTTFAAHTPTFRYHPAQFPVPQTAPTQYSSEMHPEQLPRIPPIEPSISPYYAPSFLPLPVILPPEVQPVVSSTAAHQIEASTAAAPFIQPSIPSVESPHMIHTSYYDAPLQELPLSKVKSPTADIESKVSPKEKKLYDIKPEVEWSHKELKIETKVEDVKPSCFEKGDLTEELSVKSKLLRGRISQLEKEVAEKDKQIDEKNDQITEKDKQIAERDEQIVKHQLMYEEILQDVYKPAGVIPGKRKQLEASEQGVVLKKQRLSDELSGESAVGEMGVGSEGIGETETSLKVQIKTLEAENEELKRRLSQKSSKTSYSSLLGVEVVGEEEVVVTNEAMDFHWKDYGFKLHFPENALPEGIPEYNVNIKASLSGQFELPDGYELVSAVYWVASPGRFTKAVTLEAQHCATLSNPSQLCFVRTSCTQKSLPYMFKIVDGGSFTCGSKYGVLSATRFSGNGIAKEVTPGEHSCHYCAQVYFTIKHLQDHWYYCHFVVTKDLEMCLTVVKRKYQQEYDIAPPITFVGDQVALDIPDDGKRTDSGWEIKPLHKACIKKDRVNNFSSESTWVPECVLLLKWLLKDKAPEPLEYKVKLLGTEDENDFFVIVHHPGAQHHGNVPSSASSLHAEGATVVATPVQKPPTVEESLQVELSINDLLEVTEYLLNLKQTDVYYLGLTLGLTHPHLKNMESSDTFREDMIAAWLQKEDQVTRRGLPTWETLVKALRNDRVNQNGIADKIATDKNAHPQSSATLGCSRMKSSRQRRLDTND